EQRRLRAWWRAIDLVGEHDVREDGAAHEAKAPRSRRGILFENVGARDVARHEIRRELNAAEIEVHRLGDGAHHERLREPGYADEQRVASRDERHQDLVDDTLLPDDATPDLITQPLRGGNQRVTRARGGRGALRRVRRRRRHATFTSANRTL